MDEWGETPSIYVWPAGHTEAQPFPEHFWTWVADALADAGIEWERV